MLKFTIGIVCTSTKITPYQEDTLLAVLREMNQTRVPYTLYSLPRLTPGTFRFMEESQATKEEWSNHCTFDGPSIERLMRACDVIYICDTGRSDSPSRKVYNGLLSLGYVHARLIRRWVSSDVMGTARG